MCCFSRPVERVSRTRIFARATADTRQALVYAMSVAAREDLAMILPLPVPPGAAEDAVRFVSLEGYPDIFEDLDSGFPTVMEPGSKGGLLSRAAPRPKLVVHEVGSFEASFVPTVGDFDRLDPRFRLPREVWSALPQYADWGFAVFKLARGGGWLARILGRAREKAIHPMAFEFPRRDPRRLFFPTVPRHDLGPASVFTSPGERGTFGLVSSAPGVCYRYLSRSYTLRFGSFTRWVDGTSG